MHEASLAAGIVQIVEEAAAREGFRRVARVRLEVGQLAGVEVDALRFTLDALAPGTCLEGARVDIDEPPGQAWCGDCGRHTPLGRLGDPCIHCGGFRLRPTHGTGLRVVDLSVHDD